jgi:hypothetical protein
MESCVGRVGRGRSCPAVRAGVVSSACVEVLDGRVIAAPDDHFIAGPHLDLSPSRVRGVARASWRPTVHVWIVPPAGVQALVAGVIEATAPDDHFATGPHCLVAGTSIGRSSDAGSYPSVCARVISSARVHSINADAIKSASHDHLATGPHCRVRFSRSRCVGSTCSYPVVSDWTVSTASIQKVTLPSSTPDYHFAASPQCGVG